MYVYIFNYTICLWIKNKVRVSNVNSPKTDLSASTGEEGGGRWFVVVKSGALGFMKTSHINEA